MDDYGETGDKRFLLYILIVVVSNAIQLVLTKVLLRKSKLSITTFALWVYFFGSLGSFILYCIECEWARGGNWTISEIPKFLG